MAVDCYTQIKEQASVIVVYDEKDIFARSLENLVMSAVAVPYPSAGSCMCDCLASLPIPVYASRAGAASVSQHNIIDSLPLLALAETLRQQCTLPANLPVLYWLSFLLERRGSVIHTSLGKEAGAEMSDQNTVDYEEYVQELYEFRYINGCVSYEFMPQVLHNAYAFQFDFAYCVVDMKQVSCLLRCVRTGPEVKTWSQPVYKVWSVKLSHAVGSMGPWNTLLLTGALSAIGKQKCIYSYTLRCLSIHQI